jgi:hypothetical protein
MVYASLTEYLKLHIAKAGDDNCEEDEQISPTDIPISSSPFHHEAEPLENRNEIVNQFERNIKAQNLRIKFLEMAKVRADPFRNECSNSKPFPGLGVE